MRRTLAMLVMMLLLCGIVPSKSAAKIVVGLSSVNVAFLPVYVTEAKGFFKDEGLDVLLVLFNAGATNLQALIGGDVQIMGSAFVETIGGRAAGIDIKNFWGISNIMPFQLYSQPDFKSMKQAKGKRFAISRFGSLTDFLNAIDFAPLRRRRQGRDDSPDRQHAGALRRIIGKGRGRFPGVVSGDRNRQSARIQ